jgi:hypothetical protein
LSGHGVSRRCLASAPAVRHFQRTTTASALALRLAQSETKLEALRELPPARHLLLTSEADGASEFFLAGEKRTVPKDPKKFRVLLF